MDQIIHALVAQDNVRLMAISAPELVRQLKELHGLSRVATAALGRQIMITALMASDLKNDGDKISTIIRGNGPAGNMICTGARTENGPIVKGYTANPLTELPPTEAGKLDVGGYVGAGQLTVVRDLPVGEPYVGVCNLVSGEIAIDFAQYFTVSEQTPSLVYLGVRMDIETGTIRSAGGMLLQPLPGCPEEIIDQLVARQDSIAQLSMMLDRGKGLVDAVFDILEGVDAHITERMTPVLQCDCSRERIEKALISVGTQELTAMIEEDHGAEVKCHFCNTAYTFSEEELRALLARSSDKEEDE